MKEGREKTVFAPTIWIFIWFKGDNMNQPHVSKRVPTLSKHEIFFSFWTFKRNAIFAHKKQYVEPQNHKNVGV